MRYACLRYRRRMYSNSQTNVRHIPDALFVSIFFHCHFKKFVENKISSVVSSIYIPVIRSLFAERFSFEDCEGRVLY